MWSHSSSISPAYPVAPGIAAGPYIMMPENGGIGVFAHEYGHNLGADDLYAYGAGNTSAGFWTLMADDWTGYPIGFEPPAVDPWHLDNWGWLDPMVISDTAQVYTVTLGQASYFTTNTSMGDAYRGVRIDLPDGEIPLAVPVWQGSYYWWGGAENLANGMMTTAGAIDLTTATTASLSFDLVYDIEDEWDFLWVQVSTDGVTWPYTDTLTNANTQCVHNPAWIGGLNGFPDDLCGAGIGGFYGYNSNWPDPESQTFDLTPYVGQQIWLRLWYMTDWGTLYTGAFVDNVSVDTDAGNVFFDDAEAGDANWTYEFPWIRTNGVSTYSQNFYLQWRNVNDNGGYDAALGDSRWRFGPANTGLLMWYNNNIYRDNEVWDHLFDDPSLGPKGRMLVLDSHPEPDRDPYLVDMGFDNEGGNIHHRSLMRDAPFTLMDTVSYTLGPPYVTESTWYEGRPAVSSFHDSMGYYPGAEYARRGPAYDPTQFKWLTKQWDASGVVPATGVYPLSAMGYDGTGANPSSSDREFRFRCTPYLDGPFAGYLSCYWFGSGVGLGYEGGTGNPGDYGLQYGWHVELIEEAEDHTWATVRIWNAMYEVMDKFKVDPDVTTIGHQVDYHYHLEMNAGSPLAQALVIVPMTDTVEYVGGSGFMPLPVGMSADQAAAAYAQGGKEALERLAANQDDDIAALAWVVGGLATGEGGMEANFTVEVMVNGPDTIELEAMVFDGANWIHTIPANPVTVYQSYHFYLPVVMKSQ
jgi:immune inhibitor A